MVMVIAIDYWRQIAHGAVTAFVSDVHLRALLAVIVVRTPSPVTRCCNLAPKKNEEEEEDNRRLNVRFQRCLLGQWQLNAPPSSREQRAKRGSLFLFFKGDDSHRHQCHESHDTVCRLRLIQFSIQLKKGKESLYRSSSAETEVTEGRGRGAINTVNEWRKLK